jgi:hypothetical protein
MERRYTSRNRVLKRGVIEFNGGAIDCVLRNFSKAGAALDRREPGWNPRALHAGDHGRAGAAGLPGGLAQGKADRRRLQQILN